MDLDIFTSPGFYQDRTFFNLAFLHHYITKGKVSLMRSPFHMTNTKCRTLGLKFKTWVIAPFNPFAPKDRSRIQHLFPVYTLCSPSCGPFSHRSFRFRFLPAPLCPAASYTSGCASRSSSDLPFFSKPSPLEVILNSACILPLHPSWIKTFCRVLLGFILHSLSFRSY